MERFNKVYPFTTENIAGYMDMDLTGKKIILPSFRKTQEAGEPRC